MRRTILYLTLAAVLALPAVAAPPNMPMFRWENFTIADGLPNNHVFCVLVDGNRVWAGTDNGLGVYENGKWKIYRPADGMAHQAVLSLALDKNTGDVWAGTMGGLNRISPGRIDTFTQLNSGLSNDIVYGVGIYGDYVWTATAAGASRYNTRTGQWALFNERNTPMFEIWIYAVSPAEDKVYYAVWGGGVADLDPHDARAQFCRLFILDRPCLPPEPRVVGHRPAGVGGERRRVRPPGGEQGIGGGDGAQPALGQRHPPHRAAARQHH